VKPFESVDEVIDQLGRAPSICGVTNVVDVDVNNSNSHGPSGAWQPLLDGTERERALEAVQAIADRLRAGLLPSASRGLADDPSLADGAAGLAVLFTYLAKARPGVEDEAVARRWLDRAVHAVSEAAVEASLFSGLTGIAWSAAHLQQHFPGLGMESINDEIDEVLLEHLARSPWPDTYDLISGLVGFGVYALERGPHPRAIACLDRVVDHLAEMAERRSEGSTWETRSEWLPPEVREKRPPRYYDLGLAHGIPGVIALLGRVCAAGVAVARARPLLQEATRWLMVQRAMVGTAGFPYHSPPDPPAAPARLAWCYGDPGIAAALLLAARCAAEPSCERAALAVARRAADRPPDEAGVVDAALCHGAAGLGHLFNRLFQATGEPWLRQAAQSWFQRTLEMCHPVRDSFGVRKGGPNASLEGTDYPGFLTGDAGIALALLAAATPIEPAWDRVLLVSIPPALAAP
jgi:lantibiotic modifying enzyme